MEGKNAMVTYTSELLSSLISCKKKVVKPPHKEMKIERGSFRNDLSLKSEDGKWNFSVFMRKNQKFAENFIIGLRYHPQEGESFTLLRCNGPHGNHIDLERTNSSHYVFHIHMANIDRLNDGVFSERMGTITDKYASYEEALSYFIREVGIMDADQFFPEYITQPSLFSEEGE